MKLLVVSDTHGQNEILKELYKEYPSMDYYLHAGDSNTHENELLPFEAVQGNCDYFDFNQRRLIRTPIGNILMKHHPYVTRNEIEDVKIFIHGHTHRYEIDNSNGLIIMCPGSTSHPRDDSIGSYAIIEIENNILDIKIIELETKFTLKEYREVIKN